MNSTRTKTLITVFALLLLTSCITIGCKPKKQKSWVNTDSLPGHKFNTNKQSNAKNSNSKIVYLGSEDQSVNFGPKDVSFDFRYLK